MQWLSQFLSGLATCVGMHGPGDQPRRLLFTWPSRGVSAPAGSAGHARALVVLPHPLPPSSGFNFLGSALGSPSSLPSSPLFSWPLGGSAAAVACSEQWRSSSRTWPRPHFSPCGSSRPSPLCLPTLSGPSLRVCTSNGLATRGAQPRP